MANVDVGPTDFVDKRKVPSQLTTTIGTPASYAGVANMRSRLAAVNGTYYTAARLNDMSENDLIYAIRQADDAAGI